MDPKRFAEKLGKKVSWVYRLEDPNQPPPTIPSLLEVARTFGVDLEVRFRPFSGMLDDLDRLSPSSLTVASFEHELPEMERIASNGRLQLWAQESDYAAIRRYSETTEQMAKDAGIDWQKIKAASQRHASSILWGKIPLGAIEACLSSGTTSSAESLSRSAASAQISVHELASSAIAKPTGIETESTPSRAGANNDSLRRVIPIDSSRSYGGVRITVKRKKDHISRLKRKAS